MDNIFNKTIELVRNNPADFQEISQSITKKILKNNHPLRDEVAKRFLEIWPDSRGKQLIVIGWLLSDSAIGTGIPSVSTALAEILTKRLSNDDKNLNTANPQEWIRGQIFYEEESKQRLKDAVRAYETVNPSKGESVGTATQEDLTDTGQNSGKVDKMERKDVKLKTNHKALIKALSKALEKGNTTEITRDALVRNTNYAVGSGNINQAYIDLKTWGIITQGGQNFTPEYQDYKQNPPD